MTPSRFGQGDEEAVHEPSAASIATRSLGALGYHDELLVENWSPRGLVPGGLDRSAIPAVAFWAQPFDQFRSAIAVVNRNGIPDPDIARQVASQAWTHVVVCGASDASCGSVDASDRATASTIAR